MKQQRPAPWVRFYYRRSVLGVSHVPVTFMAFQLFYCTQYKRELWPYPEKMDTQSCGILMFRLKLNWRQVANRSMDSVSVVPDFNKVNELPGQHGSTRFV